jgi:hypothetical protein
MNKFFIVSIILLFICIGVCTCGGRSVSDPEYNNFIGDEFVDSYLLYVEEVTVPDVIFEGEVLPIRLRVSADANPDILRGQINDRWIAIVYATPWEPNGLFRIDAYITGEGDPQQQPDDILQIDLPETPVGDWVCTVRAAADRSLGGKHYKYGRGDSSGGPVTPKEDLQEIRFNVHVEPIPEE